MRRNVPAFISFEDWPSGSRDLNPLDYKLWAILGDMAWRKRQKQPGQSEELPRESNGRDPSGDGVCRDSGVAGASQGLRRGRGRPF
jgi:hypothetical protein